MIEREIIRDGDSAQPRVNIEYASERPQVAVTGGSQRITCILAAPRSASPVSVCSGSPISSERDSGVFPV